MGGAADGSARDGMPLCRYAACSQRYERERERDLSERRELRTLPYRPSDKSWTSPQTLPDKPFSETPEALLSLLPTPASTFLSPHNTLPSHQTTLYLLTHLQTTCDSSQKQLVCQPRTTTLNHPQPHTTTHNHAPTSCDVGVCVCG